MAGAPTATIEYDNTNNSELIAAVLGTYHMGIQISSGIAGMRYVSVENIMKLRKQLGFNVTTPSTTPDKGSLVWNTVDDALELILANSVRVVLGESAVIPYEASESITKGMLVMRTAAVGTTGKIIGSKAVTDGTIASDMILGIAMETLTVGNWGRAANLGRVKNINTSAWTIGDTLYSNSGSAGGLTITPPTAPANKTPVAVVITKHASTGIIQMLTPSGLAFDRIDDVTITAIADKDVMVYDSGTGTWVNSTRLTVVEASIVTIKGVEWTDETIKGNADDIDTNISDIGDLEIAVDLLNDIVTVAGSVTISLSK